MDANSDDVHIGHYVLGRTIGRGGFAKVLGTHTTTQRLDMS